ncbi:MAG: hypothetical protein KC501_14675 [Myxococcales bacterium]|nr:hypothetical protein [Myxococcales bacterium]
MRRPNAPRSWSLLRPASLCGALLLLAPGCPKTPPHCPNCEIRVASFTIPEYQELSDGYQIANVSMMTSVKTVDWCPDEEDAPPCTYEADQTLAITKPGDYEEDLPIGTADNDDETVTILVLLRADGQPDLFKEETTTVE